MNAETLLDLALVSGLIVLAYRAIHSAALFTGVVLYITFGLLLSIVWVRLNAPDIAIAEAAIGAGITGGLLLRTVGAIGGPQLRRRVAAPVMVLMGATALALGAALAAVVPSLHRRPAELPGTIAARLPESGAAHEVTAVLLDFRGYDTFLEVTVLLTAVVAVLTLQRRHTVRIGGEELAGERMPGASTAVVVPAAVLIGGFLLWRGMHAPGGAFQSGAVLGAAAVLYLLGRGRSRTLDLGWVRLPLAVGALAFVVGGLVGRLSGNAFLEYPGAWSGHMILLIEIAVALSVAVTFALLFATSEERSGSRSGPGPAPP